jgi:hypothetical protein
VIIPLLDGIARGMELTTAMEKTGTPRALLSRVAGVAGLQWINGKESAVSME